MFILYFHFFFGCFRFPVPEIRRILRRFRTRAGLFSCFPASRMIHQPVDSDYLMVPHTRRTVHWFFWVPRSIPNGQSVFAFLSSCRNSDQLLSRHQGNGHFLRNFLHQKNITLLLGFCHTHPRRANRDRTPDISGLIMDRGANSDRFNI